MISRFGNLGFCPVIKVQGLGARLHLLHVLIVLMLPLERPDAVQRDKLGRVWQVCYTCSCLRRTWDAPQSLLQKAQRPAKRPRESGGLWTVFSSCFFRKESVRQCKEVYDVFFILFFTEFIGVTRVKKCLWFLIWGHKGTLSFLVPGPEGLGQL